MVDKVIVKDGLKRCLFGNGDNCNECPYHSEGMMCKVTLFADAVLLLYRPNLPRFIAKSDGTIERFEQEGSEQDA